MERLGPRPGSEAESKLKHGIKGEREDRGWGWGEEKERLERRRNRSFPLDGSKGLIYGSN